MSSRNNFFRLPSSFAGSPSVHASCKQFSGPRAAAAGNGNGFFRRRLNISNCSDCLALAGGNLRHMSGGSLKYSFVSPLNMIRFPFFEILEDPITKRMMEEEKQKSQDWPIVPFFRNSFLVDLLAII